MQNIINKVIRIENSAKKIVSDAESELAAMPEKVEKELAEFRRQELADAEKQLDRERQEAERQYNEAIGKAEASQKNDIERLKRAFEENRAAWIDKIFNACINNGRER